MSGRINLDDVQGLILRGYGFPQVRHYVLKINDAAEAREAISNMVHGPPGFRITPAGDSTLDKGNWKYALNLGLTFSGLTALKLPKNTLKSFESAAPAFSQGARRRAARIGDIGENGPDCWDERLGNDEDAHALLSVHAADDEMATMDTRVRDRFRADGLKERPMEIIGEPYEGERIKRRFGKKEYVIEHFGFRDGIAQPAIKGVSRGPHASAGNSDAIETGAFVLGFPSQWQEFSYPLPKPQVLGINGSFAAFRVLEQDVYNFRKYARDQAKKYSSLTPGELKANIVGRWPNGSPLDIWPDGPSSAKNAAHAYFDFSSDRDGLKCPVGAHIRRNNPRADRIAGNTRKVPMKHKPANKRRIIRRGMTYGSEYSTATRKEPRGLLGLFICASLEDQFEFLMRNWVNNGGFNGRLPFGTKDPLIGAHSGFASDSFRFRHDKREYVAKGLDRFVTTRGGLYCFYPGLSALSFIGSLEQ